MPCVPSVEQSQQKEETHAAELAIIEKRKLTVKGEPMTTNQSWPEPRFVHLWNGCASLLIAAPSA
jgi:hypothetical protein